MRSYEFCIPHSALRTQMFTSTGQAIQLGRQLGAGGAGTVYEIEGQPHLVAKLYHQAPSAEKPQGKPKR